MASPSYYSNQYTSVFRFRHIAGSGSAVAVWTPATSARIVLTDLVVGTNVATSVRFSFSTSRGTILGEFMVGGSAVIYPFTNTVIDSLLPDLALLAETSNVSSSGGTTVTANGFEVEATNPTNIL